LVNEKSIHQDDQGRLSQLEKLNKKNEKDKKVMRTKILALIKNLEKFDPAWVEIFVDEMGKTWNFKPGWLGEVRLQMTNSKKIQIYGKTYSLKSSSSEVDAEEVAAYVDSRMKELVAARGKTSTLDLAILTALNIAQELMELRIQSGAKEEAEQNKLQQLVEALDKELQHIEK